MPQQQPKKAKKAKKDQPPQVRRFDVVFFPVTLHLNFEHVHTDISKWKAILLKADPNSANCGGG